MKKTILPHTIKDSKAFAKRKHALDALQCFTSIKPIDGVMTKNII